MGYIEKIIAEQMAAAKAPAPVPTKKSEVGRGHGEFLSRRDKYLVETPKDQLPPHLHTEKDRLISKIVSNKRTRETQQQRALTRAKRVEELRAQHKCDMCFGKGHYPDPTKLPGAVDRGNVQCVKCRGEGHLIPESLLRNT